MNTTDNPMNTTYDPMNTTYDPIIGFIHNPEKKEELLKSIEIQNNKETNNTITIKNDNNDNNDNPSIFNKLTSQVKSIGKNTLNNTTTLFDNINKSEKDNSLLNNNIESKLRKINTLPENIYVCYIFDIFQHPKYKYILNRQFSDLELNNDIDNYYVLLCDNKDNKSTFIELNISQSNNSDEENTTDDEENTTDDEESQVNNNENIEEENNNSEINDEEITNEESDSSEINDDETDNDKESDNEETTDDEITDNNDETDNKKESDIDDKIIGGNENNSENIINTIIDTINNDVNNIAILDTPVISLDNIIHYSKETSKHYFIVDITPFIINITNDTYENEYLNNDFDMKYKLTSFNEIVKLDNTNEIKQIFNHFFMKNIENKYINNMFESILLYRIQNTSNNNDNNLINIDGFSYINYSDINTENTIEKCLFINLNHKINNKTDKNNIHTKNSIIPIVYISNIELQNNTDDNKYKKYPIIKTSIDDNNTYYVRNYIDRDYILKVCLH
jgi:hypothetical protein